MADGAFDPDFHSALQAEVRREQARSRAHAAEAHASRGVAWSGLGPDPWRPRAPDRLAADAALRLERLRDWRAGVRGRLLASVARAQRAAEAAHGVGETIRAALARDPDHPIAGCEDVVSTLVAESRALARAAREARRAVREAKAAAG